MEITLANVDGVIDSATDEARLPKAPIGLHIFDIENQKLTSPTSNREYIKLYVKMYTQAYSKKKLKKEKKNLKIKARKQLAKGYLNLNNLVAAEKQYSKLIALGDQTTGYNGLAKISLEERNYKQILSHLTLSAYFDAESHLLLANAYAHLSNPSKAIEHIEQAHILLPHDLNILLFYTSFYEQLYYKTPTEIAYLNKAIYGYQLLFENHFFDKLEVQQKRMVVAEIWHYRLANYLILLLEAHKEAAVIELLERYFKLLDMTSDAKITKVYTTTFYLELDQNLISIVDELQFQKAKGELNSRTIITYRKQIPLFFELFACAYAMGGERQKALNKLKARQAFSENSASAVVLQKQLINQKNLQYGEFVFDAQLYLDKANAIQKAYENDAKKLQFLIDEATFKLNISLLEQHLDQLLLKKNNPKYQQELEQYYDYYRYVADKMFQLHMPSNEEANEIIKQKFQDTLTQMQENARPDLQNPLEHYNQLDFLNAIWREKLKSFSNINEERLIALHNYPQVDELWLKAEKYFALLEKMYEQDPKNANMLVDTYFKICEVWLVQLIGELSTKETMLNLQKKPVKVGTPYYYTSTTIKNYIEFIDQYKGTEEKHPIKSTRRDVQLSLLGFEKFNKLRNASSHKEAFDLERARDTRSLFYTCIIFAMDALRTLDGDLLNQRNNA